LKLLLTGAIGFTGLHLAPVAASAGYQVLPLQADLTDAAAVRAEVAQMQPHAVLHLAGIAFVGHADESALYGVNTVGTTHLLAALAALPKPPAKVVLASSANVYGNSPVSPIPETQAPAPANHYAASKMAMEAMAHTYAGALPIVIARPFNYTGVGQSTDFLVPKLVSHFARKAPAIELGNLNVEREFNDVAMVCQAYLQLLAHGHSGATYNVCSGVMYSLREVVALLADITGHALQVQAKPALMRANEVRQLCGQPDRLNTLLRQQGIEPQPPTLRSTLVRMLDAMNPATGQWIDL
jgi:nucleoside-diphosphate-sugar epimerase